MKFGEEVLAKWISRVTKPWDNVKFLIDQSKGFDTFGQAVYFLKGNGIPIPEECSTQFELQCFLAQAKMLVSSKGLPEIVKLAAGNSAAQTPPA